MKEWLACGSKAKKNTNAGNVKLFGNEHSIWASDGSGHDATLYSAYLKGIHGCVKTRPCWMRVGDACFYEPVGQIVIEVEDAYLWYACGFDSALCANSLYECFRPESAGR